MGLSVLIATGKKESRDLLVSGIDWEELDCTTIRATGDGERGVALADLIRPDLVLRGEGLLRMDGAEMEQRIRLRFPSCRFLDLAGVPGWQPEGAPPLEEIAREVRVIAGEGPRRPFFRGPDGDPSPLGTAVFVQSRKDLRELGVKIRERQEQAAGEALNLLFDQIAECEGTSPDYVRHFCCQLVLLFLNESGDLHSPELEALGNRLLYHLSPTADLALLRRELLELNRLYFEAAALFGTDPVSMVNRYLKEHYTDPRLNAQIIAADMGFASSYLCLLYRRRTGMTIHQQLTRIRLEQGKDLLEHSLDRLCDIAEKCGYTDAKYFTKVFSREMGISPRRYREHYRQEQWERSSRRSQSVDKKALS